LSAVTARHYLEYLALRLAACQLTQLPPAWGLAIAEDFGALAYRLLKGRTRVGRENIAAAFPDMSAADVDALLRKVYESLARMGGEIFYLRRLVRPYSWRDYVEIENIEAALDVFLAGRGAVLVTGHLGNWELLGHVMPFIGLKAQALARPLDNPLVDRYILGVRESGLQRIILKKGAGARIDEMLRDGGFISILVDQDAGRKGVFVPFFGRPASTWRSPAIFAQKSRAPILPGCAVRVGKGLKYRVIVGRPIYPDPAADVTAETLRITRDFTSQLEGWIRAYPDQYLWLHRRWKTAPGPRSLVAE